VRGPFGTGWPLEAAEGRDVIVVAGGIGLAPLRPVIYRLMAERERYRRVVLLYGARTPRDILFRRELEHWRSRLDLDVLVTVDRADPSWNGSVGVVTRLISRAPIDPANAVAFLVGPEIMMRLTAAELMKIGLVAEAIYLSMERNMKCAVGFCGHCQFGPYFVCKDGPVFSLPRVQHLLLQREF
jgi:NAD(P)H-flavin reductase